MELCIANKAPTSQTALGSDPEGSPIKETWKYSSVVECFFIYLPTEDQILPLQSPKQLGSTPIQSSLSISFKMIIRYLSATSDKGIIFTPTTDFKVDCYVDTDFAGLHGREPLDLSASVCSRTGYIMFIYSCPLIWKSQLQTKTALRTFHAEYVALSSAI